MEMRNIFQTKQEIHPGLVEKKLLGSELKRDTSLN